MSSIIYSLFGALFGTIVTSLYYRNVIMPRTRHHTDEVNTDMLKKKKQKKQEKNNTRSLEIYNPESNLAIKALYEMDDIIEESKRIYTRTENIKKSIRNQLIARRQDA